MFFRFFPGYIEFHAQVPASNTRCLQGRRRFEFSRFRQEQLQNFYIS